MSKLYALMSLFNKNPKRVHETINRKATGIRFFLANKKKISEEVAIGT